MSEFYLRDTRSDVGSTCMFWNKGGAGYGSNLSNAELFTMVEAQEYADRFTKRYSEFMPLEKYSVLEVATWRVDMQLLHKDDGLSKSDKYYIQRNIGRYDGNDIYFDDGKDGVTIDVKKAHIFSGKESLTALSGKAGAVFNREFIETIARQTLQADSVSIRKMISNCGIKWKAPRKRKEPSGKHRHNCPTCAKFVWDYNPYDAPYCNRFCEP